MDWSTILQAAGGALEGGLEGYSWAKELDVKREEMASRERIAGLNADIRQALIDAGVYKHDTPSGSVLVQQQGASDRAAASNETRRDIADMTAETAANAEAGRNSRFDKGITARGLWQEMQDRTRRRGQDITAETAGMRDETTRRGQDVTSATQRRGQDITAGTARMRDETARRGQDVTASTTRRGQDMATDRARIRVGSSLPPLGAGGDDMREAAIASAAASDAGYSELPNMPGRPGSNLPAPAAAIPLPSDLSGQPRQAPGLPLETPVEEVPAVTGRAGPPSVKSLREERLHGRGPIPDPAGAPGAGSQVAPFEQGVTARGVWRNTMGDVGTESGLTVRGNRPQPTDRPGAADLARLRAAIAALRGAKTPAERQRARAALQTLRDDARSRFK